MNALAAIVACYGLLENSVAVIIGAMIIALLMGPITGMALALVDGDQLLLRQALLAEAAGAALVLLLSFTIGKIHAEMTLGSEILGRTSPNVLDLIIALAGGAAGAYATISPPNQRGPGRCRHRHRAGAPSVFLRHLPGARAVPGRAGGRSCCSSRTWWRSSRSRRSSSG